MEQVLKKSAESQNQVYRVFLLAWQKAALDGASEDLIASVALSAALAALVKIHGEEAAARMTERLADAIRDGQFSYDSNVDESEL